MLSLKFLCLQRDHNLFFGTPSKGLGGSWNVLSEIDSFFGFFFQFYIDKDPNN